MTDRMDPLHVHGNGVIKPRQACREISKALPKNAVVATDIGEGNVLNSKRGRDKSMPLVSKMNIGQIFLLFARINIVQIFPRPR
jgi:hypothetical protein